MNISVEQVVTWIVMAIGLIGTWFRSQFKIERLEEKLLDHVRETDKKHAALDHQKDSLWKWISEHERETSVVRDSLNRNISEIRGGMLVNNEQFKQILVMLQDFKDDLSEIKQRMSKLENDH